MQSKTEKFKSLLTDYDIFSSHPQVFFNQKRNFGTIFGACFSIVFILILLSQSVFLFSQVITQSTPQLQESSNISTQAPPIYLGDSNFSIGIGVFLGMHNVPLNSSIFSVSFTSESCPKSHTCSHVDMGLQVCNTTDLISDYFNPTKIELFCPKNSSFVVSGRQLRDIVLGYSSNILQINITSCVNGTNPGIVCKPQEEIDYILNNQADQIKIYAFYTNQYFSPSATDPKTTFLDNAGGSWPLKFRREMDIYFDLTNIQMNTGYIFDTYEALQMYSIDPASAINQYVERNATDSYFTINLRRSSITNLKQLYFLKLSDVMSLLGGFAKTVFFILSLLVLSYNQEKYKVDISNTLYNFQEDNPPKSKDRAKSKVRIEDTGIATELVDKKSFSVEREPNYDSAKLPKLETQKFKRLDFGVSDWLKLTICKCLKSPYKETVNKAYGLAAKAVDLAEIIRKIQEIDKLKELLLTKDQQILFDFMPKKIIDEGDSNRLLNIRVSEFDRERRETNEIYRARENYSQFESYLALFMAYEKLKQLPGEQNERLVKMLNEETQKNFEEISSYLSGLSDKEKVRKFRDIFYLRQPVV